VSADADHALRLRSEYIDDEAQLARTLRDLDQMQSMLEHPEQGR